MQGGKPTAQVTWQKWIHVDKKRESTPLFERTLIWFSESRLYWERCTKINICIFFVFIVNHSTKEIHADVFTAPVYFICAKPTTTFYRTESLNLENVASYLFFYSDSRRMNFNNKRISFKEFREYGQQTTNRKANKSIHCIDISQREDALHIEIKT